MKTAISVLVLTVSSLSCIASDASSLQCEYVDTVCAGNVQALACSCFNYDVRFLAQEQVTNPITRQQQLYNRLVADIPELRYIPVSAKLLETSEVNTSPWPSQRGTRIDVTAFGVSGQALKITLRWAEAYNGNAAYYYWFWERTGVNAAYAGNVFDALAPLPPSLLDRVCEALHLAGVPTPTPRTGVTYRCY